MFIFACKFIYIYNRSLHNTKLGVSAMPRGIETFYRITLIYFISAEKNVEMVKFYCKIVPLILNRRLCRKYRCHNDQNLPSRKKISAHIFDMCSSFSVFVTWENSENCHQVTNRFSISRM